MQVLIIMGSKSDLDKMDKAAKILDEFGVEYEMKISSAHRNPTGTRQIIKDAEKTGALVIIAGAGMAAHLPGVIAAETILPVIGVPLSGSALNGIDALYAIVQMPKGVPVATVAIDGTKNAALLAVQILALSNTELKKKFIDYKKKLSEI